MRPDSNKAGKMVGFLFKFMPLLLLLAIFILAGYLFNRVGVEDILHYTPENYLLAALVLIGAYAMKSLSVFFPLMVLYISAGTLFSTGWAILINFAGLFCCILIPYALGKWVGKEYMDVVLQKYKKVRQLDQLRRGSEWFFCYILRVVNLLPGDIVSLLLGSMGTSFSKYILGSLTGLAPTMIAATFMGATILEPTSPAFIASCAITVLLSATSFLLYRRYTGKKAL